MESYSLQILLAIATVASAAVLVRYRHDLRISAPVAIMLAAVHTLAGVACVKAFAGLESFSNPLDSGMSLFGGIFLLPIFYALGAKAFKRDAAAVFDVFGICMVVTLMFARVNCMLSGCCMGSHIPGTELRWPTREVEIAFWMVLAVTLIALKERSAMDGRLYLVAMVAYGAFRFAEEFFRQGTAVLGAFHIAHVWALVSFIVGTTLLFYAIEKNADTRKRLQNG